MQRIIITFDRVFDVAPGQSRGRQPCTFFSFQSGSASQFGVAAPGRPDLRDGMVLTVLLEQPDNWQTLLGWVDHGTGETVCWSRGQHVFVLAWTVAAGAGLLFSSRQSPTVGAVGLLVLGLYACLNAREYHVVSKARRVLEDAKRVGHPAS